MHYWRKYYFKCKENNCNHSFNTLKIWNVHHQIHQKSLLKCHVCPKKFHTSSSHRAHKNAQAPDKFVCESCGKQFPCNSTLCIHRKVHTNQCLYRCFAGICMKPYKWPQDLHHHIRKHLKSKFLCTECDCTTYEKCMLPCHMVKHSDVYKYSCPRCEYKVKCYSPFH